MTTKAKVVVIGGGTGLSVMLRGLKNKDVDITAIVTVADDGGSSGRLRSELQMPPPGDIRNVLVALADTEPLLEKVLQHRFQNGIGIAGHSLGNLFLAAMLEITGDFHTAVQEMCKVLAVKGCVLPVSHEAIVLHAEMTDGTIVTGESQIPKAGKTIKRVWIEPEFSQPINESIDTIKEADAIVIGPGSLYTSILPNLLVKGIVEAIRGSKAAKIYISNVMTQPGETDHYSVENHLEAIHNHVGDRLFTHVIVNNASIPDIVTLKYAEKGAEPVLYNEETLKSYGYKVISDHIFKYETYLRHHTDKLSNLIIDIIEHHRKD